jgi:hypothetical protein
MTHPPPEVLNGAPQCAYHRPCPPPGGDLLAHRTPAHDCRVDVWTILKAARHGARPAAVRTELEAVPHASSQAVLAVRFAHFTTPSCSRAGVVGLGEAGDPLGGGERGAVPGLTRSDPEPDRQMGLPGFGPSPPSEDSVGGRYRCRWRASKNTGLDYFPTQQFAINTAWLAVDILAVDPIAWPSTCSCMAIWPGQSRRRCTTCCSTSPPDSPADSADSGCPLNAPGPGPATGHRARPAHHAARPAQLTFHAVTTSGGSHRQNSTPATSPRPRAETTSRGSPSTVLHVEGIGDVMTYLAVGLPAF